MKAIQIQSYGGLEVLRTTTLSDPDPGPDEVLVRIKASAVNRLDGIVRMGHFPIAKEPPLILGEEAAGIVDRNGAGFKTGERVIVYGGGLGVLRDGTWAEAVAVPGSCLRRIPEGMSFEEAAALANVGVTAYGALRTAALKAGETLVVMDRAGQCDTELQSFVTRRARMRTRVDRASFIAAVLNRSTSTTLSSDDAALLNRFSSLFEAPRAVLGLVTPRPRG